MSLFSIILSILGCSKSTPDDRWCIATGEDNGKPMIVRYRAEIPSGVDIKEYPCLMAVSWQYEPINENGMPSKEENSRMNLFEDKLESLEAKGVAFLTVLVTCNGIKEWQYYSRNENEFMAALNSALLGQPSFPIQISQQQDPKWSAYFKFKNAAQR